MLGVTQTSELHVWEETGHPNKRQEFANSWVSCLDRDVWEFWMSEFCRLNFAAIHKSFPERPGRSGDEIKFTTFIR